MVCLKSKNRNGGNSKSKLLVLDFKIVLLRINDVRSATIKPKVYNPATIQYAFEPKNAEATSTKTGKRAMQLRYGFISAVLIFKFLPLKFLVA